MHPLRAIARWWHRRLRNTDIKILWPAVKGAATDLGSARAAFARHTHTDPAWADISQVERLNIIFRLT